MSALLTSAEALVYLSQRGIRRSPVTLQKMSQDGRLPAAAYDGRRRLYDPVALSAFAARQLKPNMLKAGVEQTD